MKSCRKISTPGLTRSHNVGMTSLERLIRTHSIWFLPKISRDEAMELLVGKECGAFIVRKSSQSDSLALTVKLSSDSEVEHYLIEESATVPNKFNLESSEHSFDNVLALVYHYATSRGELPATLKLPKNLREADSRQYLSSLALLGQDYWRYPMSQYGSLQPDSSLSSQKRKLSEPGLATKATLEETLDGLQKVSDLLQASLVDFEASSSPPQPPPRTSSSPNPSRRLSHMDSAEMLLSNQPIVQLRSKLTEEMFGAESNAKQWYSYYRSSIADKMSDYEDIWEKSDTNMVQRCMSPAESELQFKAYLANKLTEDGCLIPSSQGSAYSSSSSDDDDDEEENMPKSSSYTSSMGSLSSSSTESLCTSEVVYSDPLDVLEQADDTRIYTCPEFGEYYEELPAAKEPLKMPAESPVAPSIMKVDSQEAEANVSHRRSVSCIQYRKKSKSASGPDKRLSVVIGKYMSRPSKGPWQTDSSSWEFLNQAGHETSGNKQVDSGLESTLSFTHKSDDKDSLYESELGTLEAQDRGQLEKSRERIRDYICTQLASEKWTFGKIINQFIECTLRLSTHQIDSTLRNTRQFMNGMKNYLIRQGEGELHRFLNEERAKLKPDEFLNLDSLLEEIMHALILVPLTPRLRESLGIHLSKLAAANQQSSSLDATRQTHAATTTVEEGLMLPESIKEAFAEAFEQIKSTVSPLDKLAHLLTALKILINAINEDHADRLCWTLARLMQETSMCEWVGVDIELMWNLLPQSILRGFGNGEATYYLTMMSSAASLVGNRSESPFTSPERQTDALLTPLEASGSKSASLKSTTSSVPTTGSTSAKLLTVYVPDSQKSHLVTKNVPLRNEAAKVRDVCVLMTHILNLSDPADFALFSIVDGKETLLQEDEHPLLVVDNARIRGSNFCAFAFQRRDAQNAWPSRIGADLSLQQQQ